MKRFQWIKILFDLLFFLLRSSTIFFISWQFLVYFHEKQWLFLNFREESFLKARKRNFDVIIEKTPQIVLNISHLLNLHIEVTFVFLGVFQHFSEISIKALNIIF